MVLHEAVQLITLARDRQAVFAVGVPSRFYPVSRW